jgi:hypothetical protein
MFHQHPSWLPGCAAWPQMQGAAAKKSRLANSRTQVFKIIIVPMI